jgi:dolichol-phosphate mannosyltransferase
MKKISIVVPVYNEQDNIIALVDELHKEVGEEHGYDWHVLFVDDCSQDRTWETLLAIKPYEYLRIHSIRFSTNFGKEAALVAGLNECKESDAIIFMDGDLQHPPSMIPQFLRAWEKGYLTVSGVRKSAADYTLFKRMASNLFYKTMNIFADIELPKGLTDFKLVDQKVVTEFLKFNEKSLMFRGLIEWLGFSKKYIEFDAPARLSGEAGYSFHKLSQLAINSFTSFSLIPLKVAGALGAIIILSSFSLMLFMFVTESIGSQVFTPLAYFVVFNTFLTGTVLSSIGFTAIYIGRIHVQVVGRPLYVVENRNYSSLKNNKDTL